MRQGAFGTSPLAPAWHLDVVIGNVPFGTTPSRDAEDGVPHVPKADPRLLRVPRDHAPPARRCRRLDHVEGHARQGIADGAQVDCAAGPVARAFRLPGDAFEENAGTSVTTDVLFFQRKIEDGDDADAEWIEERREVAFMGYGAVSRARR